MRKLALVAVITFFVRVLPASADDSLSYEAGKGFYFSHSANANIFRYRHELDPLFGLSSFFEASYASWNGPDHSDAAALARGIRWGAIDRYLSFTMGLSYISRTTGNLGQPFEFYLRMAYEKSFGKALFSLGWIHYSDGKFIFGWSGPNNSENFATISLGLLF